MATYHFPAEAGFGIAGGFPKSPPDPPAIAAHLRTIGLPAEGLRLGRRGDAVQVEGSVPDAATRELVLLAIGNLRGIGRVEDRLVVARPSPGLLGSLGAFAHLPAGSANLQAAREAVHQSRPEVGTVFGPGGSLFHTVQPGESLAEIAGRHYGGAAAAAATAERILEANAPVLRDTAIGPGIVLRLPPR